MRTILSAPSDSWRDRTALPFRRCRSKCAATFPCAPDLAAALPPRWRDFVCMKSLAGPLPIQAIINAACALEAHPDNASAAVLGGLTASCQLPDGSVYATRFRWPESLAFIVVTPDIPLATADSRKVLPSFVSRADVVFNLQRMTLLLQLLQSGNFSLLKQALGDRLHQPFRQKVVPGLEQALHLEHEDLLGICLSGSGPSIVALAQDNLDEVAELLASVYEPLEIGYSIRTLKVHQEESVQENMVFSRGLVCS